MYKYIVIFAMMLRIAIAASAQTPLQLHGVPAVVLHESQPIQVDVAVALISAAAQGNVSEVDRFLKAGIAADAVDSARGTTALHSAAANGHLHVVTRLLAAGANPLKTDKFGANPIVNAAHAGHLAVVRALVDKASREALASPPALASGSLTPLNAAVMGGHRAMIEYLLASGAPPETKDRFGFSATDTARRAKRTDFLELFARHAKSSDR
jgi:uncharacterized protein